MNKGEIDEIKDATYAINIGGFKSIETHCVALYVNGN